MCFQCFGDFKPIRQKSICFYWFLADWLEIPKTLKTHILLYDFSTTNIKNIENTQSFIWFFNHKKPWNHTVFYMFLSIENIQMIENTLSFSCFSIHKSEQSLLKQKKLEFLSSHKLRPMSYERLQNGFVGFVLFLVAVVQPRTRGGTTIPSSVYIYLLFIFFLWATQFNFGGNEGRTSNDWGGQGLGNGYSTFWKVKVIEQKMSIELHIIT